MVDPNPLAGMPLAESLANNMNESLHWMTRLWSGSLAAPLGVAAASALPSMMLPTLDPAEIERRISELRTVEHWLEMNRSLLHSTIQALQMQHDAIVALRTMGQPAASAGGTAEAHTAASATAPFTHAPVGAIPPGFDPMLWWNALQQQFARVASAVAAETHAGVGVHGNKSGA